MDTTDFRSNDVNMLPVKVPDITEGDPASHQVSGHNTEQARDHELIDNKGSGPSAAEEVEPMLEGEGLISKYEVNGPQSKDDDYDGESSTTDDVNDEEGQKRRHSSVLNIP